MPRSATAAACSSPPSSSRSRPGLTARNCLRPGTTPVMFVNLPSGLQHVKSGRLRALAVATGERLRALPDVPTVAESGVPGYEFQTWFGIIAPAATPAPIVERLNGEFRRALLIPEVRERLLNEGGMQPVGGRAAESAALIAGEKDRWGKLVRETGARVDQIPRTL